ncbi:Microfibrillar-associated protein 1 [Trichinella nelsoni]|uniref:Microfibrillar-associated protein 1 n=1 Tax=Trichinella nelsoni TaxID=6336 RepID=A0A0V0S4I1_9BILA|nr:Microfibrillar-associated protein 1 [Trichinella nelsoni]
MSGIPVIGKVIVQSTAGAIPVRNEKGDLVMEKVKVSRYVAGKRPDYAVSCNSDSDDDDYVYHEESDLKKLESAHVVEQQEELEIRSEEFERKAVSDPRLRRLMKTNFQDEDEEIKVARHRTIHEASRRGQRKVKESDDASENEDNYQGDSQADNDGLTENEFLQRRALLRKKAQERSEEEIEDEAIECMGDDEGEEEVEDEESEYEEYTDSEDETMPRLKPVFVGREERATLLDAENERIRQAELELEEKRKAEERRKATVKLVEELVRLEVEQENQKREEEVFNLDAVITDDENEELAYEMWKIRELKRLKRDREEREAYEKEKQEIERVHNMTEQERRAYLRANPKIIVNKQEKGKFKFLQKYFHRGVFYLDQEDDVYKRNFAEPTLEDRCDRTTLPKVMQVKNFGKAGRTKWTHLVAEDTTDFQSPWVSESVQNLKFYHNHAAAARDIFVRPYQDFIVHEIDSSGVMVQLTDLNSAVSERLVKCNDRCSESFFHDIAIVNGLKSVASGELKEYQIDCTGKSKEERMLIHRAVRDEFTNALETETVKCDSNTFITVTVAGSNKRKRQIWPSDREGEHCHFVIYKENTDSNVAIAKIAKLLRISPKTICIAGTKDRRAVTTQRASAYRLEAGQLLQLNNRLHGVRVGNCAYKPNGIFLGDLNGNRFTIVLRNVKENTDFVEECIKQWKEVGFINYYGAQRFGTGPVHTHEVGKLMLHRKWKEAAELLLQPHSNEISECDSNPIASDDGENNRKELIPRNLRNLYIHSYQSIVWNRMVSRRVAMYGDRLLDGDLVIRSSVDAEDEPVFLTKDSMIHYDKFDLVLPLLSADAILPKNECGKLYEQILKEEGIDVEYFHALRKEFGLHGGFRKVFVKPSEYADEQLVQTDLDRLTSIDEHAVKSDAKEEDGELNYLALVIEFSLPRGSYATMALRELCRQDLSRKAQIHI